jgi:sulfite reductase alpha subunit-like flavoprotein
MVSEILLLPDENDKLALVQLFKNCGMGDGKQKRFFTLIRDIALREGLTISSYLQQEKIRAILDHEEMNVPQKIHHLGDLLQQELSPSYSLAERDFVKQLKELHLPTNYSISHSPSFERDEITLTIAFENIAACKNYLLQKQR